MAVHAHQVAPLQGAAPTAPRAPRAAPGWPTVTGLISSCRSPWTGTVAVALCGKPRTQRTARGFSLAGALPAEQAGRVLTVKTFAWLGLSLSLGWTQGRGRDEEHGEGRLVAPGINVGQSPARQQLK